MTGPEQSAERLDLIRRHWEDAASAASELIEYDRVRLVFDHWRSLWAGEGLPRRSAIEPTEIGAALAQVYVMDYDPADRSLRYRLIGEEVRTGYAKPVKGKRLSEIVRPEAYAGVASYFLACAELPAITMLTGRLYQERNMPAYGQRLLLPLVDEGGRGEALLGLTYCERFYDSLAQARLEADRRVSIFPLDGSAPTTTVS